SAGLGARPGRVTRGRKSLGPSWVTGRGLPSGSGLGLGEGLLRLGRRGAVGPRSLARGRRGRSGAAACGEGVALRRRCNWGLGRSLAGHSA
uniref:Uncharacterized protein n=1 Tax=Gopherus agassizii TaxID=38772 RepID=A0A452I3X4_9SAUR